MTRANECGVVRKTFWLLRQRLFLGSYFWLVSRRLVVRLTWGVTSKGPKDILLAGAAPELIFALFVWWRTVLAGCFHRCLNILEFI